MPVVIFNSLKEKSDLIYFHDWNRLGRRIIVQLIYPVHCKWNAVPPVISNSLKEKSDQIDFHDWNRLGRRIIAQLISSSLQVECSAAGDI